jgi:hypothetical protein
MLMTLWGIAVKPRSDATQQLKHWLCPRRVHEAGIDPLRPGGAGVERIASDATRARRSARGPVSRADGSRLSAAVSPSPRTNPIA